MRKELKMKLKLTLNANDTTAMVEALEGIKADIAKGVTLGWARHTDFDYEFEVTPTEDGYQYSAPVDGYDPSECGPQDHFGMN